MDRDEIIYAGIGAIVTVFTFFIPFSPFLGGLLAGWLANDSATQTDGSRVGLLSGAFASFVFVPLVLLGLFVSIFDGGLTLFILSTLSILGALYTLGFSALGGYVGGQLQGPDSESTRTEYDQHADSRQSETETDTRERDLERLKREYAAGRLTEAEFERRLEQRFGIDRDSVRDGLKSNGESQPRTGSTRGSVPRDRDADRRSDERLRDR